MMLRFEKLKALGGAKNRRRVISNDDCDPLTLLRDLGVSNRELGQPAENGFGLSLQNSRQDQPAATQRDQSGQKFLDYVRGEIRTNEVSRTRSFVHRADAKSNPLGDTIRRGIFARDRDRVR